MLSLELLLAWARFDAECGAHALAEYEPLITTALSKLPPTRPVVAHTGCVAEAKSNKDKTSRSLDGMSPISPLSAFATDVHPSKLQDNIDHRVNSLRFANMARSHVFYPR
jgi:hypothetical protein